MPTLLGPVSARLSPIRGQNRSPSAAATAPPPTAPKTVRRLMIRFCLLTSSGPFDTPLLLQHPCDSQASCTLEKHSGGQCKKLLRLYHLCSWPDGVAPMGTTTSSTSILPAFSNTRVSGT